MTGASRPIGRRLLTGTVLSGVVAVLDSTIVVPLLTTIGDEFDGGSQVAWLVSAYLLAATLTVPMWGRWLDLRGERAPMRAALGLFALGTALGAVAPSLGVLVFARVIQGFGAGGLVPLGESIIGSRCTPKERARLQGYITVSYGLAAGVGPVIGGALGGVSWRWAFAVILPFCAVVALTLRGQLRHDSASERGGPSPDLAGGALLGVGLIALLLGVERLSGLFLLAGIAVVGAFLWRSRTHPHGLIPRSVLTNRITVACGLIALVIGFAQYAHLTYLPSLAQELAPQMNPGLVVIPLTVMWMTMGSIGAVLALRIGTRNVVFIALLAASGAGATLLLSLSVSGLFVAGALIGAAAALGVLAVLLLAQFNAAPADLGATTAFIVLLRNCGGALGVSGALGVYDDFGLVPTLLVLATVAAAGVLPAALIPGRRREARMHLQRVMSR